ncbi:MAG: translation elongation factor Ts [Treponema sp.]|jgi:elongation factor Ts|nr:translation elongation factor Ts [Treponema sp.]
MAAISAAEVKALREKTGAGMMECKNALAECEGDAAKAEKLLKERGLAAVEKRAGRAANEGRIFAKENGKRAVLVELASETDFVARNPEFIALGEAIAGRALEKGYTEVTPELSEMVSDLAAKIRENMSLKRVAVLDAGPGELLSTYLHGDGAIGVAVRLASDKSEALALPAVQALAHDLALHVSWAVPQAISRDAVAPAFVKENEEIFRAQMAQDESLAGKPEGVLQGILKGKLNKFLSSICLLDQGFVKEEKSTVAKVLEETGKAAGAALKVTGYLYFKVGA